ncbi:aminopeptidase N-like [Brienomyrus brachyistius]|uniref:aminopeptidase N-like n=1 Tax=Brienomyrus brachyistius TaxID=42636 RepID=UPI0020B1C9CA|nr:aminopeptidase N-like [Brienomyrus brachyistius]
MSRRSYLLKRLAFATALVAFLAIITVIAAIITCQKQKNKITGPGHPNTEVDPSGPPPSARLPKDLIPDSYRIYIQVHLHTTTNVTDYTSTFSGNSTVKFWCVEATQFIIIHCKELNVTSIHLTDERGSAVAVKYTSLKDDYSNFLEIELTDTLRVNTTYYLFTAFEGLLGFNQDGLYISQYNENTGNQSLFRFLVASQLESVAARRVFPCFDEPAMKAVFNVTVIHRLGTVALSNAAQKDQKKMTIDREEWLITEFHPTLKMSTYLLALTVSEYTCKTTDYGRYVLKTWARPDAVAAGHVDYAHSIAGDIIEFFEDLYDIKYPLNKLDQIAVQNSTASGMENWGLIIYQEEILLYDKDLSPMSHKFLIAEIVAHEIAHQWFGNLVTMEWWNDLWLNEGFSTYMSYFGVDKVEPTWNFKELFFVNEVQGLFEMESKDIHRLLIPDVESIVTPHDIEELFHFTTYSKGATVLRMLSSYVTETVFVSGVKSYLKAYQYKNAEHQDLWRHIQEAVNNDTIQVANMMESWTKQPGFPLITINTLSGNISQRYFGLKENAQYNIIWQVPITLLKSGSQEITSALLTENGPVSNPIYQSNNNEWILANVNCTGFYRVNYDPDNWDRLLQQLGTDHHMIPVVNRAQLIDDAFALALTKDVNITLALSSTKYLHKDLEYIPWATAWANLHHIILMLDRSEDYRFIEAYLRKQVTTLYDHFEAFTMKSSVPDLLTAQYHQTIVIEIACGSGLSKCQKMAIDTFNQWRQNSTSKWIHPNLRSLIYCAAIAAGGRQEWEFLWQMFQNTTAETEKDVLRDALSCTKDTEILKRLLEFTLDPDKIKKNEFYYFMKSITENVAGQSLVWDFIQKQWTYLNHTYGGEELMLGSVIEAVTERFSSETELQELKQFLADHGGADFGSELWVLEHAIERAEANIKWVEENRRIILEWFRGESVAY